MNAELGPVSARLATEVAEFVRRNGIACWLDLENDYTDFVDRLAAAGDGNGLRCQVHGFRGSYLELMLALEGAASGIDKSLLLIHLPGFNEDQVKASPLLELYSAGARYRYSLATLVKDAAAGRVPPDRIEAFCAGPALTLQAADDWLSAQLQGDGGGLSAQLQSTRLTALVEDLLTNGFVARGLGAPASLDALWEHLASRIGLTRAWREGLISAVPRAEEVAHAVMSWALCVEYVGDLKRAPVDPHLAGIAELPAALYQAARELADYLRDRHPAAYRRTADETEALLSVEVEIARAEDLGAIDTFRFEGQKVLEAVFGAVRERRWNAALESIVARHCGRSFWLRDDPSHGATWDLLFDAARLGCAIDSAGAAMAPPLGGLAEALEAYVERGAAVDRRHRLLEQRRAALLQPQVSEFEALRAALDGMRPVWRHWADGWARQFNQLCVRCGFLPASGLRQRSLFDDVVRPLAGGGETVAYFLVDALRYEMGEQLAEELRASGGGDVRLEARLAELPTVTEVGMNVLAPVAQGERLSPVLRDGKILGFSTGEFRVGDPESRKRAIHDSIGGDTCPWLSLEDVVSRDATGLRRAIARAKVLVVHSQEIDEAGENGLGLVVFDHVLQKLRTAWRLLRDAGVSRFVITADHGFLLHDETAGQVQSHGRKVDPARRHAFSPVAADHRGEVRVPLSELGYRDAADHLMMPESTSLFVTGRRPGSFVHGGNSLQERVIPVLTVVHRRAAGASTLTYAIAARAGVAVGGMHCIEGTVTGQAALPYGGPPEVELSLTVLDEPGARVELCQARGGARLVPGGVVAAVDQKFELFFRVIGTTDARVRVELGGPGPRSAVVPCIVEGRFAVTTAGTAPTTSPAPGGATAWLGELPEGGVRQLFEHLAVHGTVTESEAASMVGGPRALRRFAREFETHAAKAPFRVRIDVVAGVKRYIREGTAP